MDTRRFLQKCVTLLRNTSQPFDCKITRLALSDEIERLVEVEKDLHEHKNSDSQSARQPKPFYVVYSEFSLPTNPGKQYEVMSCVAAKSGEAARAEALGHISDLYGTLEHLYQSTAKFTDPNLTN